MKNVVLVFIVFLLFHACKKSDTSTPQAAPTISDFMPKRDTIGGQITITGTNFSTTPTDNIVTINRISATVISATTTQLNVLVPNAILATGTITVTISGQTAKAASNFTTLSRNELLVLGNWHYATTIRNDTVIQNGKTIWESSYPYSNLNATFDYLNFTDSGVVYSFQSAWGIGQSGKQYKDTVSYTISNNTIILTYPSGMNNLGNAFAYLSYYDTISIKALTSNYFSLTRNHHFKHYTFSSGETKQSADSLTK